MSLHALAGHMAAKGRGSDSMLVHMTPEEVQSLQVLALKGGGTLTINPETGLPEANFLKKMLPMIAGFALGPAGFGLMSAGMAGAAVGGITALSTGSLSRGLMAGLGAYGGASLGAGLTGAGEGAMAASDIAAQQAAGTFPTLAEGASQEAVANYANQVNALRDTALSKAGEAGLGAKLAAGAGQMASNPGMYARELMTGLAAISPMLADEGVQTTTKRPDTGMIRNYTFDPYGQTYTSAGNYPASEYKGMARGGIVALAEGGTPGSIADLYTPGSVEELYKTYAGRGSDPGGLQYWTQQFGDTIDPNEVNVFKTAIAEARGLGTEPVDVTREQADTLVQNMYRNVLNRDVEQSGLNYWADMIQSSNDPTRIYNDFLTAAQEGSELGNFGLGYEKAVTPFQGYTSADTGSNADEWVRNVLGREVTDADRNQQWYKDMGGVTTTAEAKKAYNDFLQSTGATTDLDWMAASQLNPLATIVEDNSDTIAEDNSDTIAEDNSDTPPAPPAPSAVQNTTTRVSQPTDIAVAPDTALPVGVSGAGITTINPNGTVTTTPNIPGRPAGGFTGMTQVRDAYTQGGGSLGYVNKAPTTMEEFNERFNRQTGDSLAAYEYLMGRGANNNAYPTKSGVEQIMRPYSEVTMGIPPAEGRPTQKYIFDAATKRYVENPNYRPLSYNSAGERFVGLTPTEVLTGLAPFRDGTNDAGLFDFVTQNRISEAQLAAALGISIAEARARLAAAKKTSTAATNANVQTGGDSYSDGSYSGGGGGSNTASNNAPVESMGTDTGFGGDGAGAGAPGGGNAAGGPGNSGDGGTGDSSTAVKRGGLLPRRMALGGLGALAGGGSASQYNLGSYSDGGRLLRGPGDGVSDSIPATIGGKQPARLADGEFVVPARIVSELGNGSTEAGARKLYAMMDRVQKARGKTTGKKRVAANTRADKYLPA